MDTAESQTPKGYRTLWISDLHLGSSGAQAEDLLRFLRQTEVERIYLVGDIIDLWALRRRPYWPSAHMEVIRHVLARAVDGVSVTYVPGNHDHAMRAYSGQRFGQVMVEERALHLTADGQRMLVMHGDEFDRIIHKMPWLAHVGDVLYDWLRALNKRLPHRTHKDEGMQPQTLSANAKHRVKQLVHFLSGFERRVEQTCRAAHAHGIICGHSHHAEITRFRGILYCNDGDWVESRTALVEHHNGRLELLRWPAMVSSPAEQSRDAVLADSST
ncbi:MAG: UDP-2,3-diacylglucosamine diphosphatase [Acidihalobacter sp.]